MPIQNPLKPEGMTSALIIIDTAIDFIIYYKYFKLHTYIQLVIRYRG